MFCKYTKSGEFTTRSMYRGRVAERGGAGGLGGGVGGGSVALDGEIDLAKSGDSYKSQKSIYTSTLAR